MPKGQGYDLPVQRFRAEQDEWDRFGEVTTTQGTDRSKVLRQLIAWYLRIPGAKLPKRPDVEHGASDRGVTEPGVNP